MSDLGESTRYAGRRQGNTFRRLLKALALASEGKGVFYHSKTMNMRNYYFKRACSIVESQLPPSSRTVLIARCNIQIHSGFVRFVCEAEVQRGVLRGVIEPDDVEIFDD